MRFLLAFLATIWLALPAAAADFIKLGPNTPVNGMSGPFDVCPTMIFKPSGLQTGAVSIYSRSEPTPLLTQVEASSRIARLTPTSGTIETIPPYRYIYAVVDAVESNPTSGVTIECVNAVNLSKVDSGGNGLFDYISFPQDLDGDGVGAVTCTGAGEPDDACSFAGEQVWPDFIDDFNAADDMVAVGGVIECTGDWLLPVRSKVCDGGTNDGLSCNLDADCSGGGTCERFASGYADQYSWPSGLPRTTTSSNPAYLPALQKSGATFRGSGPDLNYEKDGHRAGCVVLNDLGSHPGQAVDNALGSLSSWSFGIGSHTSAVYGDPARMDSLGWTAVQEAFDPGTARLCLCNSTSCAPTDSGLTDDWVQTNLSPGDWVHFEGVTYVPPGETAATQPIAQVKLIYPSDTCGTGNDSRYVELNVGQFDDPASVTDALVYKLDERTIGSNITVKKLTWAPQNPFPQFDYGADAVRSSTCTQWDGATGDGSGDDQDNDCDTSSQIGMFKGFNNRFTENAIHHPSSMQFGVVDGQDGSPNSVYDRNYFGPGYVSNALIDTGTSYSMIDNVFEGCSLNQNSTAACIRTLGEDSQLKNNQYLNVGAFRCSDDPELSCNVNGDCSGVGAGSCVGYPATLVNLANSGNRLENELFSGIVVGNEVINVDGSDHIIDGIEITGLTGNLPNGIALDGASNITVSNNVFNERKPRNASRADFGSWIYVREEGVGNRIFNNLFREDESTTGYAGSPIKVEVGSTGDTSDEMAQTIVSYNTAIGYDRVVGLTDEDGTQDGVCSDDTTTACDEDSDCGGGEYCSYNWTDSVPPGAHQNVVDGIFLIDRGDIADGSEPTCDGTVQGWAYTITGSDDCGASATANTLSYCYCNGSAWTEIP